LPKLWNRLKRAAAAAAPYRKNNPIASELIPAAALTNAALCRRSISANPEHERATHGWQVEWLTAQMMMLTGGALKLRGVPGAAPASG
jgi:adenylosuccinate lyase